MARNWNNDLTKRYRKTPSHIGTNTRIKPLRFNEQLCEAICKFIKEELPKHFYTTRFFTRVAEDRIRISLNEKFIGSDVQPATAVITIGPDNVIMICSRDTPTSPFGGEVLFETEAHCSDPNLFEAIQRFIGRVHGGV